MPYRIFLDSFTSLDDLPKKQRSDPDALLKFFKDTKTRRASTFEMDQPTWRAMKALEARGELIFVETGYPWHGFRLKEDPLPSQRKSGQRDRGAEPTPNHGARTVERTQQQEDDRQDDQK